MQLRYDEDLVEAAVFLCTSGRRSGVPALQIARFQREREKPYAIPDPDERNAAFFKLHLDWFREWGLETVLASSLKEFPLLPQRLNLLAVRKARGKSDEGAELYVNEAGQRTGILALRPGRFAGPPNREQGSADFSPLQRANSECGRSFTELPDMRTLKRDKSRAPERFAHDAALRDYLRHEFTHLHDMVDPAFAYSPVLELPALNAAQQRLARERYRLLWDITIDGRLTAAGHAPMATREQHAAAFLRGYSFWTEERQVEVFNSLWRKAAPRHAEFLALIADPRGLRDAHRPTPGASCPLCDFPTFSWADGEALTPEITARVTAEFPAWLPEHGLCGRCRETYEVAASLEMVKP